MERPQFIISGDLNITLILDGETNMIGTSHPNHERVLEAITNGNWDALPALVDIPKSMSEYSSGAVQVNEFGEVTYNGEEVHNTIAERITKFFKDGLPFEPLVRFLENLMQNSSHRAIQELYPFLENEGMAITEDGCFVGYKGIRNDWTDVYTGTINNSPGMIVDVPRHEVCDDPQKPCSRGLHVGSQKYASNWSNQVGRVVLVKVNPRDAVSVPYDHNFEKLRVCRYEVLREVEKTDIIESPLFDRDRLNQQECDDWADDECPDCDEYPCVCDEEDDYEW